VTMLSERLAGHAAGAIARRVEKQLTLAEWEECGPGRWRQQTNEWTTPAENEEGRDDR
jgi:hypothetical protein